MPPMLLCPEWQDHFDADSWASQVALVMKKLPARAGDLIGASLIPRSGRSLEEGMQPTPVFLPGEPHGQRSLEGYSP